MTVILEHYSVNGIGAIEIRQPIRLAISAREAQRRVNSWLSQEISIALTGGEPVLVVGKETRWQIPIIFTAAHIGYVDEVGSVELNAESGKIEKDPALIDSWLNAAATLQQELPAFQAHELPNQYFTNHTKSTIPSASRLSIQADGELAVTTQA